MAELAEQGRSMLYQEVQKRESLVFHDGIELKGPLSDHQIGLEYSFL